MEPETGDTLPRGRFITFEGGEGAGKSTQIALASAFLEDRGIDHIVSREPGGSPGAEEIRRLLVEGEPGRWDAVTEMLLHFAARRDHIRTVIEPALAAGQWVLCDRFVDSTLAYQGYGHALGEAPVRQLAEMTIDQCWPDLTLILDLPVEAGLGRAATRMGVETRYERMDIAFHQRLRDGFLKIAATEPTRCRVVDASDPVDEVAGKIKKLLEKIIVIHRNE
ncbi:MAG: dTMP kinase [Pseudomonadota bacterium]